MRQRVLLAVAALGVVTHPAPAQTSFNFGTVCSVGFQACASAAVEAVYYAGGVPYFPIGPMTELRFQLSNPQGLKGIPIYDTGPRGLRVVDLYGLSGTFTGNARPLLVVRSSTQGQVTAQASLDDPNFWSSGSGLYQAEFNWDFDSMMFGCDVPAGASPFGGYDATCGGSITYSVLIGNANLQLTQNSALGLTWRTFDAGQRFPVEGDEWNQVGFSSCRTDVDCVTVTPEPGSIALIGTGLAFASAVRRRRRRNG